MAEGVAAEVDGQWWGGGVRGLAEEGEPESIGLGAGGAGGVRPVGQGGPEADDPASAMSHGFDGALEVEVDGPVVGEWCGGDGPIADGGGVFEQAEGDEPMGGVGAGAFEHEVEVAGVGVIVAFDVQEEDGAGGDGGEGCGVGGVGAGGRGCFAMMVDFTGYGRARGVTVRGAEGLR